MGNWNGSVYHRICLTQIEIFRFIVFCFVCLGASGMGMLPSTSVHEKADMTLRDSLVDGMFLLALFFGAAGLRPAFAQVQSQTDSRSHENCRVQAADYKGWHAQQISNPWVQVIVVPQNGGRLIQVSFAGHPYLFVNPKLAGKYLPPSATQWFNYGGDKLWPLPEGNNDEQHWVGNSDVIDDGPFAFRKISEGQRCEIELTGPADPQTGIQFSRTIALEADVPGIHFHAVMKNVSGHTVEWSMQSVSQYDTSAPSAASSLNHNFWAFTPADPFSSYLNRYHVRFGPAENPAASVRDDGFFNIHYAHLAAELWIDSKEGWLAVVDGSSSYAMVERFDYEKDKSYPGKASVIFWTNGPELRLSNDGIPSVSSDPDASPYYMEAELNSPMCRLRPGESCAFNTEWFPTRAGSEFHGVTDAGIVIRPLQASHAENGRVRLTGSFGVFFPGRLVARFYDEHGASLGTTGVTNVKPTEAVVLQSEVVSPAKSARVSLHLEDVNGLDRGSLQEIRIGGDSP